MRRSVQPNCPERNDLMLLRVAQDVGHAGERGHSPARHVNVLRRSVTSLAGFQVSTTGRFWVSTEGTADLVKSQLRIERTFKNVSASTVSMSPSFDLEEW